MKLLLSLLLATACASAFEMNPSQPQPTESPAIPAAEAFDGFPASVWKVTGFGGTAPLDDHPITFAVDEEGQINGHASCNRFGGACQFGPGTVQVGPLRTTRRACEPDIMRQEQKFLSLLEAATSWEILDSTLVFRSSSGEIIAARQDAATEPE